MFLLGNFQHSLDDKNRIRLPSNFRKEMGDEYFLMPGSNGCIFVYKADETQNVLSTNERLVIVRFRGRGIGNPQSQCFNKDTSEVVGLATNFQYRVSYG